MEQDYGILTHRTLIAEWKRLLRETYRLNSPDFKLPENVSVTMCWMFVGAELPTYQQVDDAVRHILKELQTIALS